MNEVDDLILVHQRGGEPITLPRSRIVFTDRSRMDVSCLRKRYLEYEYGGPGYVSTARNEDLTIGAAVHEGVDLLLQGGSLERAMAVASQSYLVDARPWGDWLLPEQQLALTRDGIHLVQSLVYAFYVCYLPRFVEEYETLAVEEEINWVVRVLEDGRYVVCMSRPDAIVRHRETGRLWHVSHKTAKRFDDLAISKLDVDIQRFSEGFAIEAKYGEPVEGTLYNYFLKGDKRRDDQLGVDRYTSGLIRPYVFVQSGGDITPEMVRFNYTWQELNQRTGQVSKRTIGKGWEKSNIYDLMDHQTYLDWLREKWIQTEGTDYLIESIAGMVPCYWDSWPALRWLTGVQQSEMEWVEKVGSSGRKADLDSYGCSVQFPLASKECFAYTHRCAYFDICWRGKTPDDLLEDGSMMHREPNHLIEFYEGM